MPHATEREIVLGVIDRRIRDVEQSASAQWSRDDHCGFARSKTVAEYLKELKAEIQKALPGRGGPRV
jgi:hypothetical protein